MSGKAEEVLLLRLVKADIRSKALWMYESAGWRAVVKTLLTDGTMAMVIYRLMQWSRRHRLGPLEMVFNKLNGICCRCVIGRGAEFGPGFVLIHSMGVFINGAVRGGANVKVEHEVTIGAEGRQSPVIGDDVFIGAGAKIVGTVRIGDGARIGVNAAVFRDVPAHATAAGNPAQIVSVRRPMAMNGSTNGGISSSRQAV